MATPGFNTTVMDTTTGISTESTTKAAMGQTQYMFFIYLSIACLIVLVVTLVVLLLIHCIKQKRRSRSRLTDPKEFAENIEALARYYSVGYTDALERRVNSLGRVSKGSLDSRRGKPIEKQPNGTHKSTRSLHRSVENILSELRYSSVHSPTHESYIVKRNPIFTEDADDVKINRVNDITNNNAESAQDLRASRASVRRSLSLPSCSDGASSVISFTAKSEDELDMFTLEAEVHSDKNSPVTADHNTAEKIQRHTSSISAASSHKYAVLDPETLTHDRCNVKAISLSRRVQVQLNAQTAFTEDEKQYMSDSSSEDDITVIASSEEPPLPRRGPRKPMPSYENTNPQGAPPARPPKGLILTTDIPANSTIEPPPRAPSLISTVTLSPTEESPALTPVTPIVDSPTIILSTPPTPPAGLPPNTMTIPKPPPMVIPPTPTSLPPIPIIVEPTLPPAVTPAAPAPIPPTSPVLPSDSEYTNTQLPPTPPKTPDDSDADDKTAVILHLVPPPPPMTIPPAISDDEDGKSCTYEEINIASEVRA